MVLRLAAISSAVVGSLILVASIVAGWAPIGVMLVAGLALGALNGRALDRLYGTGLPMGATSLLRIVVMSAVVLGAVIVIGPTKVWPFILGVGVAQLALAGCAAYIAVVRA